MSKRQLQFEMNNVTQQLTIRSETTKEPTVAIIGINMLLVYLNSSSAVGYDCI